MAKYCKSCGKEYSGSYCDKCGYGKPAERSKTFDKYKSNRQLKEEKLKKAQQSGKKPVSAGRIIALVVMVAAVIGLVIWALIKADIIGTGDKTEPVKSYFEAIAENDYDKYVSTMPEAIADTYDEYIKTFSLSKDSFIKDSYSDYYQLLGDSFTVTVNCGEETELGGADVMDAEETFKQNFGEEVTFKKAYKIYTEVVYTGDVTKTYYYDVYVAKIGFSWYIVNIDDYFENDEAIKE